MPSSRSAYAALAVAWLATRAYAVLSVDLTPWILNDIDIYRDWAPGLAGGAFPVGDPAWQYPPGIAPVFVLSDSLLVDYRWGFTLVILAVDALLMGALLLAHARRQQASWRGPWLWALAGVVVGPIMMVRFDVVPTTLAGIAVLLAAQPARAGVMAALGALTKVWPALVLLALPRRSLPRALLAAGVTIAVVGLAFLVLTDDPLSFLGNQRDRGLQMESVGALPYEWWDLLGGDVEYDLQYGSVQVIMSAASLVGTIVTGIGLLLLAVVAWARLTGRLEAARPGDVALTVMLVSVATSRVYSPQFNVWLVGLAAVAVLDPLSRLRRVTAIVIALSLVTQVVYPWLGTQLREGEVLAIAVQSVRITLLLVALALSLTVLTRSMPPRGRITA